jgi:3',5'-cyclic AMP phosphodiesterase CpdA
MNKKIIPKSRTWFISAIILVILSTSLLTHCGKKDESKFHFIFMTDIHLQPEGEAPTGFHKAIQHANSLNPDFTITGGDLIMDALGQDFQRADSLYKLYNEYLNEFQAPVYNTIGNHEVFGLYTKSGVDPSHPEYGKQMFKNRLGYGKTYCSFDHKGWHFMLLDGIGFTQDRQYYGHIDSSQIEWIKNDLSALDTNTPIAVSIHIPFYSISAQISEDPTAANSKGIVVTNANQVLDLFKNHNLKMVISGHLHWIEEIIYQDVHHINAGAVSGGWWDGPHRGVSEGFAVIKIKGDEFEWTYEDYGWHVPPDESE